MNWKNGRPDGWENPYPQIKVIDDSRYDCYEIGADAMHKADLEFLRQFPDVVRTIQAHMTQQQWFDFIGKKT